MSMHPAFVDVVFPRRRVANPARVIGVMMAGSLFTAVAAQVAIVLPWTPVPVTGQTFAVVLLGALLGARLGAATMALYLVEGACGLPVFANGGAGVAYLIGPTAGYLVGFVPAAWLAGWGAERGWDRSPWRAAAAMTLATAVIFGCGLIWLATFVPLAQLPTAGLIPFLPGAAVKILAATALLPLGWAGLRRLGLPVSPAGDRRA